MATGSAQILRETDNQFSLLWYIPNATDGAPDLISNQPNLVSALAAIDALKTLVMALPGILTKVTVNVTTRE